MGKLKNFLLLFLLFLPVIYADINTTNYFDINTHQTLTAHYSQTISYAHIAAIILIILILLSLASFFENQDENKKRHIMYRVVIFAAIAFAIPALLRHFFNQGIFSMIFENITLVSFGLFFIVYNIFFIMNFGLGKIAEKTMVISLIIIGIAVASLLDNLFLKATILLPLPLIIACLLLFFGKKLKKEIQHLSILITSLILLFILWDYLGLEKLTILQLIILMTTITITIYAKHNNNIKIKKNKFEPTILQIFFILMIIFIISASINIQNTQNIAIAGQENENNAKIWNMEFQTHEFSEQILNDLRLETNDIHIVNGTYQEMYEDLEKIHNRYSGKIDDIYRLDKNGIIIARYPYEKGKIGQNYSNKPGVKETLIDYRLRVTDIIQTSEGEKAVTIVSPVFLNDEFQGILRINIYLSSFTYYFDQLKLNTNTHGVMFDNNGEIIASRGEYGTNTNYTEEFKEIINAGLNGVSGTTQLKKIHQNNTKTGFIINYRPVKFGDKNFLIILYSSNEEVLKTSNYHMDRAWQLTLIWAISLILLAILTNYFMTKELKISVKEKTAQIQTEKEDVERKVVERTIQIQTLLDQKTDFINQLSHDLRTPLSPIVTILPLIKKEVKNKKTQKDIDVCIRNADYLNALVNKILDLARLEAGRIELQLQKININNLTRNLIKDRKIDYLKANIKIINKVESTIMVIDPIRITEVIDNLLSNSKKHMPGGGMITVGSKTENGYVLISIKDNGEGIKKEDLDHLFQEFFKADSSRHETNSFGLGLAISRYIVELHGGKIWAESKGLGEGATFFFTLPLNTQQTKTTHSIKNSTGEDIKPRMVWTPNLSVNDIHLDNQHRSLIQKLNEISEARQRHMGEQKIKETLLFLENYANEHFKDEEEYMRLNGYDELEQHKKLHQEFFRLYEKIKENLLLKSEENKYVILEDFMTDWMTKHIIGQDQKYARYIQEKKENNKKIS